MGFRKVDRDQIDEARVTLTLIRSVGGALYGRVSTLAFNEKGEGELMSTDIADPPLREAIELAEKLAAFKEQDVDLRFRWLLDG